MLGGYFSRSQAEKEKEQTFSGSKSRGSKKRTNNSSSSSSIPVSSNVSSNTARTQSNHHHHHKSNSNNNSKSNAKTDHTTSNNNLGGGSLSISAAASTSSTPSVVHASTNDGVTTHSNTTTIATTSSSGPTPAVQSHSTIVKLSPAPSSTGSARTSSPIVNVTLMKKYRDEPSTSRTPDMSTSNNSSSSIGGLKFAFEPQSSNQPSITSGLVINTNTQAFHHSAMKESPPSSPSGSEASARKRRKATPQVIKEIIKF